MKNLLHLLLILLAPITLIAQIDVASPSGHVGVGGITAPEYKLDINGDTYVRGTNFLLGADRGLRFVRGPFYSSIDHYGTGIFRFRMVNGARMAFYAPSLKMLLYPSGTLRIWSDTAQKTGGGPWAAASDKRLKKDITPYEKGLSELLSVNPINYRYTEALYKDADKKEYVGVIAQELEKVVPTMVSDFELVDEEGEKKGDYLSVDPNEFTYMLINAVKEQQKAIEAKDEQVEALTQEVATLGEEIAELRALVQNNLNDSSSATSASQTVELGTTGDLFQNEPNPFSETTRIRYSLTRTTQNALLQVSDMNGSIIKTIRLDAAKNGEVIIEARELAAGTYFYTLIADGKVISTKQMILTE